MKPVLSSEEMDRSLKRIAHEILEKHKARVPALVGIRRRGEFLAQRLAAKIHEIDPKSRPDLGILDINLYRDDLTRVSEQPVIRETIIEFSLDDRNIVLVDDVLYTGRTVRCALDAVMDFGRPKVIELAVLVDRGHRELPIKADYVGKNIPTRDTDVVHVHLKEIDGEDVVVLENHDPAPTGKAA